MKPCSTMTDTEKNVCTHFLTQTEKCIDACQKLIATCSGSVPIECAEEYGYCKEICRETIQAANDMIKTFKIHSDKCQESECKAESGHVIKHCTETIRACEKTIENCNVDKKTDNQQCVDAAMHCIDVLNKSAQACKACLGKVEHKLSKGCGC